MVPRKRSVLSQDVKLFALTERVEVYSGDPCATDTKEGMA
jgi:hypothetical protein